MGFVSGEAALFVSHEVAAEFSRGREPTEQSGKESKALKGRRSIQRLNLGVAPSGLKGAVCHESGGFHPRLNSVAASRLITATRSLAAISTEKM